MSYTANSVKYKFQVKHHVKILCLLAMLFMSSLIAYAQFDIPEKPSFIPPVIDSTNTLSQSEYKLLYNKLKNYSDSTSTEIIIVIIPTTKGENIGLLTPKWAHEWGIGQAKEDNGVFILLAKDDRKIWISPGYGVEDRLTAGVTGELVRNIIIPEFKKGDYYQGLNKGADAIFEVLTGAYQGTRQTNSGNSFPVGIFFLLFIIFIIFLIAISKNRRGGGNNGKGGHRTDGTSILDAIILSNMGRGSYRGGSSGGFGGFGGGSSGGFGGFGGGGGFSGGGAGGSW